MALSNKSNADVSFTRYLANYERFHFFGEDVDDAMAEMRKTSIAGSLQTSIINFGSMSSHNPCE